MQGQTSCILPAFRMDIWQRAIDEVSADFERRVAAGEAERTREGLIRVIHEEWRPKFPQIAEAVAPRTEHDLIESVVANLGF